MGAQQSTSGELPVDRLNRFLEEYVWRTFLDPMLPGLSKDQRRALCDAQVEVLAGLAAVDVGAVGLSGFGTPGNYVARQVDR